MGNKMKYKSINDSSIVLMLVVCVLFAGCRDKEMEAENAVLKSEINDLKVQINQKTDELNRKYEALKRSEDDFKKFKEELTKEVKSLSVVDRKCKELSGMIVSGISLPRCKEMVVEIVSLVESAQQGSRLDGVYKAIVNQCELMKEGVSSLQSSEAAFESSVATANHLNQLFGLLNGRTGTLQDFSIREMQIKQKADTELQKIEAKEKFEISKANAAKSIRSACDQISLTVAKITPFSKQTQLL